MFIFLWSCLLGGFPRRLRNVGRVSPRRATFFLVVRQERRQRNVPRCRAPFGGSLLPGPSGGVCANSPCGLKHAQPFFRLPNPPVGAPEGTGNAGDQGPVPDSSSAGARCIRKARSDPAGRPEASYLYSLGLLSTAAVMREMHTSLPSSLVMRTSHTWMVRPRCRGRASP